MSLTCSTNKLSNTILRFLSTYLQNAMDVVLAASSQEITAFADLDRICTSAFCSSVFSSTVHDPPITRFSKQCIGERTDRSGKVDCASVMGRDSYAIYCSGRLTRALPHEHSLFVIVMFKAANQCFQFSPKRLSDAHTAKKNKK